MIFNFSTLIRPVHFQERVFFGVDVLPSLPSLSDKGTTDVLFPRSLLPPPQRQQLRRVAKGCKNLRARTRPSRHTRPAHLRGTRSRKKSREMREMSIVGDNDDVCLQTQITWNSEQVATMPSTMTKSLPPTNITAYNSFDSVASFAATCKHGVQMPLER